MSKKIILSILVLPLLWLFSESDLAAEKLSLDHPLVAQALSFKDPQHPQAAHLEGLPLPIKSGTPAMIFVSLKRHELPPQVRQILLARPTLSFSYNTPGGHFKIHYDTSGVHEVYGAGIDVDPADGHPDYVNRTGECLDYVWSYEVDTIGLEPPPADDWYPEGGDSRYDVYLVGNLGNAFGLTQPDSSQAGNPQSYTSWVELRTDYTGFGYPDQYLALKVTAAHEFFHTIHLGYDAYEPFPDQSMSDYNPWWLEASAVWMEDVVYDQVNDYINYLPYFFGYPWLSLHAHDPTWQDWVRVYHMYASCVWPIYLSERFGTGPVNTDIIRDIWEGCAEVMYENIIPATDSILGSYYSGINSAFGEFTIWIYFSGDRNESGYFSEGNYFPALNDTQMVYTSYPVNLTSSPQPPEYLAANYVKFIPFDSTGGLRANFTGAFIPWKVNMIGYAQEGQGGNHRVREMDLDDFWEGTQTFNNWTKYGEIVMIPAVVGTEYQSGSFDYSLAAAFDTSLTGSDPVQIVRNRLLHNGNVGELYLDTLIALDGLLPYTWTIEVGVVPPGLQLSESSGIIEGLPNVGGYYPIKVEVADNSTPADTDTAWFGIYVYGFHIVRAAALSDGNVAQPYLDTLIAESGFLPYTWTIEEGAMPPGLELSDSSGIIQGVPTDSGRYSIKVRATDSSTPAYTDTATFEIFVNQLPNTDWVGQNFPNPFKIGSSEYTYFPFDQSREGNVLIRIYTVAGEFVKEISICGLARQSYRGRNVIEHIGAYWDGTNDKGEPVAGGVYLYYFQTDRYSKVKKLALIR